MTGYSRRNVVTALAWALAAPTLARAHQVQLPDHFNPTKAATGNLDWLPREIHVVPDDFYLCLMYEAGTALRYGVAVGRKGLYQPGVFTVARKAEWPWCRPTPAMIRREPSKYVKYKNGMKGGPNNPLGCGRCTCMTRTGATPTCESTASTRPRPSAAPCRTAARG